MVTFPARIIIDKRIYKRTGYYIKLIDTLYHNKDYSDFTEKITTDDIEKFHIRFNLYDMEQKIYIMKERELYEIKVELNLKNSRLKDIRLEMVADAKIMPDYDYNNIWGYKIW